MSDRQRLVLALSITEVKGTIDHLRAGPSHPYVQAQITDLTGLLLTLVLQWAPSAHIEQTLVEARAYLTEHVREMEGLLMEMADGQA